MENKQEKAKIEDKRNEIIWLTGESGSGKTTIAKALNIPNSIILDGDDMRECVSVGLGFSREDRLENNLRIAKLSKILSKQYTVIVSVIAPMEEARKKITTICNPNWIYLERNLPEREGHFYEIPKAYFTINNDKNTVQFNAEKIRKWIDI